MKESCDMSPAEMVNQISQHPVFSTLSDGAKIQLRQVVHCVTVEKNKTLFSIGQEPNFIYYVVNGIMELYFPNNTKVHLEAGELIGEIGVLNGDFRLGSLVAIEDCMLIGIYGSRLFDPKYIEPSISLQIIRILGKRVTNYLRSIQQTSTQELILKGENERVEFKSTLRWNLRAEKKDKAITHASLKTIAAFLNTDGGILLIGVADEGTLLGLSLIHI